MAAIEQVKNEEPEAWSILEAAGVNEQILLDFSREDLKDLFDGVENFMLRRRLWKILEQMKECSEVTEVLNKRPMPSSPDPLAHSLPAIKEPCLSKSSTPRSISSKSSRSSSPLTIDQNENTDDSVFVVYTPVFTMYSDSELSHASRSNSLSEELFHRLIRNTVFNMRATCQNLQTPREPISTELEDMARAMCKKFPCVQKLPDGSGKEFRIITEEEKLNLTKEQKDQLHIFVFKKLKKRHSNSTPARKPQGKVPNRSCNSKRIKLDLPKQVSSSEMKPTEEDTVLDNEEIEIDAEVSARYYKALDREQKKARPNKAIINKYLNLEFASRRRCLEVTAKEERPMHIFETYPCFKDPCEVVEEVRRSLGLPESKNPEDFMEKCIHNLKGKVDPIIYYGIMKGAIKPPKNPTIDGKIIHLLEGIRSIFKTSAKGKASKATKGDGIFHVIEVEEPDDWQRKRSHFIPGLVVSESGAAILLGRKVFIIFQENEMLKAVITLVACFYLLDLDYPSGWLVSLSLLQRIIFDDNKVHPECQADTVKGMNSLERYCNEALL